VLTIKKKDKVIVKAGKDKGKTGEVLKVFPEKSRIIVSKINFIKKHTRATQTAPGGITEKESPIHISNVALICPKCNQATRVKIDRLSDGKKIRVCRKCGEMIV
jgi:large subunit ribosomal protein L24